MSAAPSSSSSSSASSITRVKMSSSFQQARLAEQLRLSKQPRAQSVDIATDSPNSQEEATTLPTSAIDAISSNVDSSSSEAPADEARDILAFENEILGPDVLQFSPMMTYEKYLTMQEKRVKISIRYSAEAGLRPFYLTVANQIKSTHPDVLLEKRILPPVGSDAGGEEAIFEVVVDGKTIIGKKKTKMLKVSSRSTSGSGGEDGKGEVHAKDKGGGSNTKPGSGETNAPDIAEGRSIFVSMEKLDQELTKARKRRRPNTMYKSKEDALRGAVTTTSGVDGGMTGEQVGTVLEGGGQRESAANAVQSTGMKEAVMRLERLKAMSSRSKI
eukprot:CAMPEP_0181114272 /NCGR_PEP_ID=MMETSP1071-20121207/20791_1 /TAXON_ID=35127 /ORGANISM="Thalassiosira sp., Strain NH16" /LENGTH=328 /DNA_ID=CAMNT_0023198363 /DNA_START=144 /DNA_END=1131 /DNA_ORIENTATION=-